MAILAQFLVIISMAFGSPAEDSKDDTPNAAVHYRRAIAALPKFDNDELSLLDDYLTDPLSNGSRALLEKAAVVLREAKAGANIKRCNWGAWTDKELNYTSGRFMPISQIGRLICLNARAAIVRGQVKEGLEELTSALQLASDEGRHGPWISKLVQMSLEKKVIDLLELQLPSLDQNGLKALEGWLRSQPDRGRLSEATKGEKAFMEHAIGQISKQTDQQAFDDLNKYALDPKAKKDADMTWKAAGGNVSGLVKLSEHSIELLGELDEILLLPSDKVASAFTAYRTRYQDINPLTCSVSRTLERVRWADDRVLCRFKLIETATAIRQRGPAALGDLKDPYGRPVIYEPKDGGFVLRTETNRDGDPLATVTVGGSQKGGK